MMYRRMICDDQPKLNSMFSPVLDITESPPPVFTAGAPLWGRMQYIGPAFERYRDLKCPSCWKINQFKALARGLDPAVKITATTDFIRVWEGLVCCSRRAAEVLGGVNPWGVKILELPGDPEHFLLWAEPLVKVNPELTWIHIVAMCPTCGGVQESVGGVGPYAMELPTQSPAFFAADITNEPGSGRKTQFHVDEAMYEIIQRHKFTGATWPVGLTHVPPNFKEYQKNWWKDPDPKTIKLPK